MVRLTGVAKALIYLVLTLSSLNGPAVAQAPVANAAGLWDAVRRNDLPLAVERLRDGANPNGRDGEGFTPLMVAAGHGQVQMVELLLTAGADVNMLDPRMGASALHKAAQSGSVDVARLLLDQGAFIDLQTPTLGRTPLMDAAWHKHLALVRYLLSRGAKTKLLSHTGDGALDTARGGKLTEIERAITERDRADAAGIAGQSLMMAVKRGDLAAVRSVLASGARVDEPGPMANTHEDGYTPLGVAARDGHAEIVRELLRAGADPRLVDGLIKATPGHKAGYNGHADVVRALTERNGTRSIRRPPLEIDAQGPYNGFTALHDAVWQGHLEAARAYVAAGARLDLRSQAGLTPRELAVLYGYADVANMLAEAEASRLQRP